jgi:hypothetical protein
VKREILSLALNETAHALRYAESVARRFATDIEDLEAGSRLAISVRYIRNRPLRRKSPLELPKRKSGALSTKLTLSGRDSPFSCTQVVTDAAPYVVYMS